MSESLKTRLLRHAFNLYPAYRGAGARVRYIAADWREVVVQVRLSWRTFNYVGTIFGGSMYAAVDPLYMIMLIRNLGDEYIVWDKTATIHFKKPGRGTLTARFTLDGDEIDTIRRLLETERSVDRTYFVELVDKQGDVCAKVEKVLYVRRKNRDAD
jgi:acyl-coenzyme A thioesterase PaaI-like protein